MSCVYSASLTARLSVDECSTLMASIDKTWTLDFEANTLSRNFEFKNYYETMAFANAVAWIAQKQNHHPDMLITYRHCKLIYTTHSINGISINDFICAAHIDSLN